MGNFQSAPGFLRYDGETWTSTTLTVHEKSGDNTTVNTTTWRGFAISADGEEVIFTGQYEGWEPGHAGKRQSLFTGSLSGELAGVYQNEIPGTYYEDVAISDDGSVRVALKKSTNEFIISTDSGNTFTRNRIFWGQLVPNLINEVAYKDRYTLEVINYDPGYTWTLSSTSGTVSISDTGIITVQNPVGQSTVFVTASRTGVPDGTGSSTSNPLEYHVNARATWAKVNSSASSQEFATGDIFDIAISPTSGELYVAGTFTDAAGNEDIDYVARFDGTNWHPLLGATGGLNPGIETITSGVLTLDFDAAGNLYAGGNFFDAGGDTSADFIAKWNGSSWSALGTSALNDIVRDIEVLKSGHVLAGGEFTSVGAISGTAYLAEWNGITWSQVGSTPLNGSVFSIEESKNENLYVGGDFSDAGGNPVADRIAKLSGSDWMPLGSGFPIEDGIVRAIAIDDRTADEIVYAGRSLGGQLLFKFANDVWSEIELSFYGAIHDLQFVEKYGLFVAGRFSSRNLYAAGLGLISSDTWYGIGDNTNSYTGNRPAFSQELEALAIASDGTIYAGGSFAEVASQPYTARLARTTYWTLSSSPEEPQPENSGPSAGELERRRLEQERAAKKRAAWTEIIKNLQVDSPVVASIAMEAGLEPLNEVGIKLANSMLMSERVETRTSESFIQYVFTKSSLIQDLVSEKPRESSVKKLISFQVLPSNMKYSSYMLYKIKKLPWDQRSDLASINAYIQIVQEQIRVREAKIRVRSKPKD